MNKIKRINSFSLMTDVMFERKGESDNHPYVFKLMYKSEDGQDRVTWLKVWKSQFCKVLPKFESNKFYRIRLNYSPSFNKFVLMGAKPIDVIQRTSEQFKFRIHDCFKTDNDGKYSDSGIVRGTLTVPTKDQECLIDIESVSYVNPENGRGEFTVNIQPTTYFRFNTDGGIDDTDKDEYTGSQRRIDYLLIKRS